MRINVVHAVGRIFEDVPVEIELAADASLDTVVDALPAIAAAAAAASPEGRFAGLAFADGERSDWVVEGRGANGRTWSRTVEAVGPAEASFQAMFSILEDTHAGRPSDVDRLVENMRRLTIVSVAPESPAPSP